MPPTLRISVRLPHCFRKCLQHCFYISGPAGAHYSMITVSCSHNKSGMVTTLRFLAWALHNVALMVLLKAIVGGSVAFREVLPGRGV